MPEVSVIVPNYNHSAFLKQRIDTILNQTYQDFELIILDDRSTDNSQDIIEQFRGNEKVSHIIYNEQNSGSTFKQWEKGLNIAIGKYIWIAESDDWCEPTLLETLVNGLSANDQCALAYVQSFVIIGENNILAMSGLNFAGQKILAEYVPGNRYVSQYLGFNCTLMNASMAVFKKQYYLNITGRFKTFRFCGDWLFWIEMAQQGEVFISGKVLNYFRKHDKDVTSKMRASGNNFLEELRVFKILRDESLISVKEYKKAILSRYIEYLVFKYAYSEEIKQEIEKAFYFHGTKSFKQFLILQGNKDLIMIKINRRAGAVKGKIALYFNSL